MIGHGAGAPLDFATTGLRGSDAPDRSCNRTAIRVPFHAASVPGNTGSGRHGDASARSYGPGTGNGSGIAGMLRTRSLRELRSRFAREPRLWILVLVPVALVLLLASRQLKTSRADSAGGSPGAGGRGGANAVPSVDLALARAGLLRPEPEYTGTTRATREVAIRARSEGRLLSLNVDVGDAVRQGQELARLDDELQRTALRQAESELLSRQSEVVAARSRVAEARTRVEQARMDLSQRQLDFSRTRSLWGQGYESRQAAEQALTATRIARQVVSSEQQQVANLQAAVKAAEARVAAQRAIVAQEKERLSYALLRSPIQGAVTARMVDTGDLIAPGAELLRVGDFRFVQVDVLVSELELSQVSVGQPARVRIDALGGAEFAGRVDRISPQADPVSRQVPVAVTLDNASGRLGAGMLARVQFGVTRPLHVLIPETALSVARGGGGRGAGGPGGTGGASAGAGNGDPGSASRAGEPEEEVATVYIAVRRPAGEGKAPAAPEGAATSENGAGRGEGRRSGAGGGATPQLTVQARQIRIGGRADGQAEVVGGLRPGELVVARSSRPLRIGDTVRPSLLSMDALNERPGETTREEPREAAPGNTPDLPRGTGPTSGASTSGSGAGSFGRGTSSGGGRSVAPSGGGGTGSASGQGRSSFGGGPISPEIRTSIPALPAPVQSGGSGFRGSGSGSFGSGQRGGTGSFGGANSGNFGSGSFGSGNFGTGRSGTGPSSGSFGGGAGNGFGAGTGSGR